MNTEAKLQIKNDLYQFVKQVGSQNAASKVMLNVSNATISNILADKWNNIADSMWLSISKQIAKDDDGWIILHDTKRMRQLQTIYSDAQLYNEVFCVVAQEGSGKTVPASVYASVNENVFLMKCGEHLNRKTFLSELLQTMGKDSGGRTVYEMMGMLLETILRRERPVIIFDEADKLSDQLLYFFITIYNETEDKCGIVLQATDHLQKRIEKGVRLNKKGFKEMFSRMGRRFLTLPGNSHNELKRIAEINGVYEEDKQIMIANDCEGDIRRVKRLARAFKRQKGATA